MFLYSRDLNVPLRLRSANYKSSIKIPAQYVKVITRFEINEMSVSVSTCWMFYNFNELQRMMLQSKPEIKFKPCTFPTISTFAWGGGRTPNKIRKINLNFTRSNCRHVSARRRNKANCELQTKWKFIRTMIAAEKQRFSKSHFLNWE